MAPAASSASPPPEQAEQGAKSSQAAAEVTEAEPVETLQTETAVSRQTSLQTSRSASSGRVAGKVANKSLRASRTTSRLVSAYDVTLLVRSRNPTADAHDPNVDRHEIPSHHVPSIVSIASKTLRQSSTRPAMRKREMAKAKARRAAEAVKSTSNVPPAYWRSAGSKRFAQPAATQPHSTPSALPLLSFRNPWDSFQPPSLLGVWRGLKWGLPDQYNEGGHSKYRGKGRHARRAGSSAADAEAQFGKRWTEVEVLKPDWGWVDAERKTWLEGPNVEHEKAQRAEGTGQDGPFGLRREWQDPRADRAEDSARVTWLGHASTLLQLPPLADPVTETDPDVEQEPGTTSGNVRTPLATHQARDLVNQISSVNGSKHEPGSQRRQIIIREDFAVKNRHSGARPHAHEGLPAHSANGMPVTQDNEKDATASTSEQGSEQNTPSTEQRSMTIDDNRDRSINLLFDPVFSKRCSPSQTVGPVRFTEAPCQAEDLPPIDIILLSHDHYDHSDVDTLKRIRAARGNAVHVFAGLGNKDWLCSSAGFKKSQVSELDWWDEAILTSSGSPPPPGDVTRAALRVICTPAQHGSGRVPGGKDSTLWCSWVIEQIRPAEGVVKQPQDQSSGGPRQQLRWRAFFAGDTGLRRHGEKATNRKSPVCPAFEEIAKRYGTPHLFLLPISIGSSLSYLRSKDPFPRRYSPFPRVSESLTSSIHMDAEDAVQMMEIMTGHKAETDGNDDENDQEQGVSPSPVALAVHYGTFVRNAEQTKGDVRNLRSACQRHGVEFGRTREGRFAHMGSTDGGEASKGKFLVSHQGETVWIRM
ncbi:unnamed protein product [Parajaminaea phylloscopi]